MSAWPSRMGISGRPLASRSTSSQRLVRNNAQKGK
jgi:hypothetical protein